MGVQVLDLQDRSSTSVAIASAQESAARAVGVVSLGGIAVVHLIDFFGKWHETRYVAVLYLALIAGTMVASALLLSRRAQAGWILGAALALLAIVGYSVSRIWGLPGAGGDIGNWGEPIGAVSLLVEGFVFILSASVLNGRLPHPEPR